MHKDNHYESGMQIPISVIIFGIAGSYIRYLYKAAHLKITHNELNKIKVKVLSDSNGKSLKELQMNHSNAYALAVVSFAVGHIAVCMSRT